MEDSGSRRQNLIVTLLLLFVVVLVGTSFYLWKTRLDLRDTNDQQVRDFYVKLSSAQVGFSNNGDFIFSNDRAFEDAKAGHIAKKEDFLEVDLSEMKLTLYKEGVPDKTFPVLSKGREGSWWETPTGNYSVIAKEQNHFSSIGGVWMPWSIQFYGNYFIHGWPYYEDGTLVSKAYSGGCVRVSTEDAREIYNFTKKGVAILLKDGDDLGKYGKPVPKLAQTAPPVVSAVSYMIVDLATSQPILKKNAEDVLPIASLTKLMTGIVASELIYLERPISVRENSLASSVTVFQPKAGEKYMAFDLLYPLLMQSSNEAAELLAGYTGRDTFVGNMNRKAASLLMDDTSLSDSSGKLASNTSSAMDLEKLLKYIYLKRRFLFDITKGIQDYRFEGRKLDNLANFNEFQDDKDLIGLKNGETTAAKQTLAGVWEFKGPKGKVPIAIIILGSNDRKADAALLLKWFKENFDIS